MTAPEKGRWYWAKNWLHYHWLYLIVAAVALWVGISWLGNALHWGETLPDYQIAYVGKRSLPDDTAHAIENAFAQYGEDLNGDGAVCVRLNQYVSDTEDKENASTYALAAQMQFLSDMNAEDSYFLLLDDPAHFQRIIRLLPTGTAPRRVTTTIPPPGKPCAGQTVRPWPKRTLERIRPLYWERPSPARMRNWSRICIWAAGLFMKMQKQKKPPAPAKGPNGCGRT